MTRLLDLMAEDDLQQRWGRTSSSAIHMARMRGQVPPWFKEGRKTFYPLVGVEAFERARALGASYAEANQIAREAIKSTGKN